MRIGSMIAGGTIGAAFTRTWTCWCIFGTELGWILDSKRERESEREHRYQGVQGHEPVCFWGDLFMNVPYVVCMLGTLSERLNMLMY